MKRIAFLFVLLLVPILFTEMSSRASAQSAPGAVPSNPPSEASPSSGMSSAQNKPETRITAYTLPPDLYRKARNRGRINFATRIAGFFYDLLVLWFILLRRLSAKFRDWAERVTRFRFVQAIVFTLLLVLTISVLQLPVDIFEEIVSKVYRISVQTCPRGSRTGPRHN